MDFFLDLGAVIPIKSIEIDFLNVQAQAKWHQLILPKFVTYAISLDVVKYSDPIQIYNPHNPNPAENPDIIKLPLDKFVDASDRRHEALIRELNEVSDSLNFIRGRLNGKA